MPVIYVQQEFSCCVQLLIIDKYNSSPDDYNLLPLACKKSSLHLMFFVFLFSRLCAFYSMLDFTAGLFYDPNLPQRGFHSTTCSVVSYQPPVPSCSINYLFRRFVAEHV